MASVILLSLAFAPIGQFYLAWVGLVPWLILVGQAETKKTVFWWSWLAGVLFFAVNMWWLVFVTLPGAAGLVIYLGIWFAFAGLLIWRLGLVESAPETRVLPRLPVWLCIVGGAVIWTASEWVRGWLFTGLPWLFLGHTQTPILPMCQIADITGALGVTFWIVLINAWIAMFLLDRKRIRQLIPSGMGVGLLLLLVLVYGLWRMSQNTLTPGPSVMVVQSNFPQSNTGDKGATQLDIALFHLFETHDALRAARADNSVPDLVVWSETMMPSMSPYYRDVLRCVAETTDRFYRLASGGRLYFGLVRTGYQEAQLDDLREFFRSGRVPRIDDRELSLLDMIYFEVARLARNNRTNLLVGVGTNLPDPLSPKHDKWIRVNSASLFDTTGKEVPARYDKIHLVPFGEYIPFRNSVPLFYHFFNIFNPYKDRADYTLTPGENLTVFPMSPRNATGPESPQWKFVAPICFEDTDAALVASMFRGPGGAKRADFIVNLTNDGWFRVNEMAQHLQVAVFRSIENRAPTARSVNTGISGFIDPFGRVYGTLEPGVSGISTGRLLLDSRTTLFTRFGDAFAGLCGILSGAAVVWIAAQWMKNRRARRR